MPIEAAGLENCTMQAAPARQVNFKIILVLLETSEASYHAVYDDCTFKFLIHAGVSARRLKVADIWIHRNAHLHFMGIIVIKLLGPVSWIQRPLVEQVSKVQSRLTEGRLSFYGNI